jgi:hypothetical protein
MSELTARSLIEARLNTYTGDLAIYWPNTIEEADITDPDGYIRATYQTPDAFQAECGGATLLFRHPGLFIASVFVPRGGGAGAAITVADTLAALFRGKSDSSGATSIIYRAPRIREVGAFGDWYQIDVEVPVERDTQFTVS